MTRDFTSTETDPRGRGTEFGETHRDQIAATVAAYTEMFDVLAAGRHYELDAFGVQALRRIADWAPDLADELEGIADGAGQPAVRIAALNARTEIIAALRSGAPTSAARGECSTVVALGGDGDEPVAVQNWDWFAGMSANWLHWTIPHLDGRRTTTITEYGILGKIGLNSHGVGVLFNILHHRQDGRSIGVPVHTIARQVLDTAVDVNTALVTIGTARVSASTALTVIGGTSCGKTAVTAEVWPAGPNFVLPSPDGLLLHTNHFLHAQPAAGDTEPAEAPDTLIRYESLQRQLHGRGATAREKDVIRALSRHDGGSGSLCCHPDLGAATTDQYQTLATVRLSFAEQAVHATAGPPCGATNHHLAIETGARS